MLQGVCGREQLDVEVPPRQVAQRQARLDGGHSGACDEDAM
jgi:hypothetical protein